MKNIMDFIRKIVFEGTLRYVTLPIIWELILLPIWIVFITLIGIWCWVLFILYIIKYGFKEGMKIQMQEHVDWVHEYCKN